MKYKLVPTDPTLAMCRAAAGAVSDSGIDAMGFALSAAIAVAPAVEVTDEMVKRALAAWMNTEETDDEPYMDIRAALEAALNGETK